MFDFNLFTFTALVLVLILIIITFESCRRRRAHERSKHNNGTFTESRSRWERIDVVLYFIDMHPILMVSMRIVCSYLHRIYIGSIRVASHTTSSFLRGCVLSGESGCGLRERLSEWLNEINYTIFSFLFEINLRRLPRGRQRRTWCESSLPAKWRRAATTGAHPIVAEKTRTHISSKYNFRCITCLTAPLFVCCVRVCRATNAPVARTSKVESRTTVCRRTRGKSISSVYLSHSHRPLTVEMCRV